MWADYPFPLITTPASMGDQYTDPVTKSATKMALTHNIIIRGMNSIYLQCEFITPESAAAFMMYCKCWSEFIHNHHACEEVAYFPVIEKAVGLEGISESNLEQHDAFLSGLEHFDEYIRNSTPQTFSGLMVLQILDTFAATLQSHLTDEVVWIMSLSQYPQLDIGTIDAQHGLYVKAHSTHTRLLPFFLTNHDLTYEDGIHAWWPTGNKLRQWYLRYICTLVHRSSWNYSSCGLGGKPKPLVGVTWCTMSRIFQQNTTEIGPEIGPIKPPKAVLTFEGHYEGDVV